MKFECSHCLQIIEAAAGCNGQLVGCSAARFEGPVVWKDDVQYNLIVNDWFGRAACDPREIWRALSSRFWLHQRSPFNGGVRLVAGHSAAMRPNETTSQPYATSCS